MSAIKTTFILSVLSILFLLPSTSLAEKSPDPSYLEELVTHSREKNLSDKRFWRLLLHYKNNWFGQPVAQPDGRGFFNSPQGKKDPQAELEATLKSFFKKEADLSPKEEHPQCDFAARYKWLKRQLEIDPARLPDRECKRLNEWLHGHSPQKITLVFASYYMNNPASMFGHTLLRIDSKFTGPKRKLLNYGVNYAANPDTDNPIAYMLKGLFGFFPGTFTTFPYYVKVQRYSNFESRDLWEYELNLTNDEMDYLMLHIWELGGTYFDYYYFQENCSYHILSLLEVARPETHLTDDFFFFVIPADTVKSVLKNKGLVSKVVYRPSVLNQMNHKKIQMDEQQLEMLTRISENPKLIEKPEFQNLETPSKALILDAYLDYLQYLGMRMKEEEIKPVRIPMEILLARSKLKHQRKDRDITRFSTPPELGHGTDRFRIGGGINDDETFEEVAYRLAHHDLMAKDAGYNKDSQILFLDTKLRYYNDSKKFRLDSLKLVDIISLTPYDPVITKYSWKLGVGFDTVRDLDCDYCNSYKGSGGIGFSFKLSPLSPVLFYTMIDVEGEASDGLREHFRVGGGGIAGLLIDFSENWRLQILGDYKNFPLGHDTEFFRISAKQRYSLTQDIDLRMEYNRYDENNEGLFAINFYF